MKHVLTFLSLFGFNCLFAQVTITCNFPSNIKRDSAIDVQVTINKGSIANFAKYQMDVPAGLTVTAVDTKTGNFTFENNKAKVVWVSIPPEAALILNFKVSINSSVTSPAYITQVFFFLDNGVKKKIDAEQIIFTVSNDNTAASNNGSSSNTVSSTAKKTEPVKTESPKTEPAKSASTTSSSSALVYKVQLGSFAAEPVKSIFAGAGKVNISKEGGMYKVLAGNFSTKKEAVKLLEQLNAKGFTGFIVVYDNGVRVK